MAQCRSNGHDRLAEERCGFGVGVFGRGFAAWSGARPCCLGSLSSLALPCPVWALVGGDARIGADMDVAEDAQQSSDALSFAVLCRELTSNRRSLAGHRGGLLR